MPAVSGTLALQGETIDRRIRGGVRYIPTSAWEEIERAKSPRDYADTPEDSRRSRDPGRKGCRNHSKGLGEFQSQTRIAWLTTASGIARLCDVLGWQRCRSGSLVQREECAQPSGCRLATLQGNADSGSGMESVDAVLQPVSFIEAHQFNLTEGQAIPR